MRRGDVGRGDLRNRGRSGDGLARWRHHGRILVHHGIILASGSSGGGRKMLGLVVSPGVGVVVNPRVTSEFIRATEALGAAGELACMWFLPSMCANMSGLVFQAMEGTIAERTLVRTREILSRLLICRARTLHHRR